MEKAERLVTEWVFFTSLKPIGNLAQMPAQNRKLHCSSQEFLGGAKGAPRVQQQYGGLEALLPHRWICPESMKSEQLQHGRLRLHGGRCCPSSLYRYPSAHCSGSRHRCSCRHCRRPCSLHRCPPSLPRFSAPLLPSSSQLPPLPSPPPSRSGLEEITLPVDDECYNCSSRDPPPDLQGGQVSGGYFHRREGYVGGNFLLSPFLPFLLSPCCLNVSVLSVRLQFWN